MPTEDVVAKLAQLGAERLAMELAKLAFRNDEVYAAVERLMASPKENLERFMKKLNRLRRGRKYYDWKAAAELAWELEDMLEDLRAADPEPKQGLELLAKFYACDRRTLERCDDSNGWVGSVFSETAASLFAELAQRCSDKAWVADLVFRLYLEDDYGVRHGLLGLAMDYLPEEEIKELIGRLIQCAKENPEMAFQCRLGAETLAEKLGDPRLFERAALFLRETHTPRVALEIAEVYLKAGEPETALEWLDKVPRGWDEAKRNSLLYQAYEALGDREKLAEVAWRMFKNNRSVHKLNLLLRAIGEEWRGKVIEEQVREILGTDEFRYEDASFLIDLDRLAEAEVYIIRHRDRLDGYIYRPLLAWAKALEGSGYLLGATVVYRALLESILERANTKYYHHGVRYLRKLEALAGRIRDWGELIPHREYFSGIREVHKRKRSFWGKYEGTR